MSTITTLLLMCPIIIMITTAIIGALAYRNRKVSSDNIIIFMLSIIGFIAALTFLLAILYVMTITMSS